MQQPQVGAGKYEIHDPILRSVNPNTSRVSPVAIKDLFHEKWEDKQAMEELDSNFFKCSKEVKEIQRQFKEALSFAVASGDVSRYGDIDSLQKRNLEIAQEFDYIDLAYQTIHEQSNALQGDSLLDELPLPSLNLLYQSNGSPMTWLTELEDRRYDPDLVLTDSDKSQMTWMEALGGNFIFLKDCQKYEKQFAIDMVEIRRLCPIIESAISQADSETLLNQEGASSREGVLIANKCLLSRLCSFL